jgi:hypothetical protein
MTSTKNEKSSIDVVNRIKHNIPLDELRFIVAFAFLEARLRFCDLAGSIPSQKAAHF